MLNCGACGRACGAKQFCWDSTCSDYTCSNSGYCFLSSGEQGQCCGAASDACTDTYSDNQNCGQCDHACNAGQTCTNGYCLVMSCGATANANQVCLQPSGGSGTCCGTDCITQGTAQNCGGCGLACPLGADCINQSYCAYPDAGYAACTAPTGADAGSECAAGSDCTGGYCVRPGSSCDASSEGAACDVGGALGRCCASSCTSLQYDNANCGACGIACGSGSWCNQGQCQPLPTCDSSNSGAACPIHGHGGICCMGQCVDAVSDPSHCGYCGAVCPTGELCAAGQCAQADGGPVGCFGVVCPAGQVCGTNGACLSPECPAGQTGVACAFGSPNDFSGGTGTCCSGTCVDLQQDPGNCGACGTTCASGICSTSFTGMPSCTLAGDDGGYDAGPFGIDCALTGCFQQGLACIDHRCLPVGCSGGAGLSGACATSLGTAGVCCEQFFGGANCADLSSDPQNCGACGWACPSGQTCSQGACSGTPADCGPGHHGQFCDLDAGTSSICCPSGCADLRSDGQNCGNCGNPCASGLACLAGRCTALSCDSSNQGYPCAADGGAGTCCAAACVDEGTDLANCGACGHRCPGGTTCAGGHCGVDACGPTNTGAPCHLAGGEAGLCCDSACVDTGSDPNNCGGCGLGCGDGGSCANSGCQ